MNHKFEDVEVKFSDNSACCVVMASDGYPEKYDKGFEIKVADEILDNVYFAGAIEKDGKLYTNSGRVLGVTGVDTTLKKAIEKSYDMLKQGKADAYVNDNLIVLAYSIIDDNLEVAIQNLGNPEFLGIGVRKGNTELLDLINKELVTLSKQGFFERSYDETFKPFYQGAADKKYFLLDGLYAIF